MTNFYGALRVLLIVCLIGDTVLAQTPAVENYFSRVSPPSPEAGRFVKYGTYEMRNSTGKPTISIPIYDIKTPNFNIPVSLSYESTGATVDDLASWVGSGWLLNTGGVITRTVIGQPDDGVGGFLTETHRTYAQLMVNSQSTADYMKTVSDGMTDTEPDIYYYNFNGHSGQFTFDQNNNVYQIPQTALKIERVGLIFQITDEKGNLYTFGANENSSAETDLNLAYSCANSWWLTRIENPEKTEQIDLQYETDRSEAENRTNYGATYGPNCTVIQLNTNGSQGYQPDNTNRLDFSQSVTIREWQPKRLTQILFKNGKVVFNRLDDRLDGGSSRLDNIEIYRGNPNAYTKLRTVKFVTSYFQYTGAVEFGAPYYSSSTGKYRLKLDRLETWNSVGNVVEKHGFEYETSTMPTYRGSLAQDFWGYYNGEDGNNNLHTLLPSLTTWNGQQQFGGANRESNETAMKAGMLRKIIYPTGGYTIFNWEAHKYEYSQQAVVPVTVGVIAQGNNYYGNPHPYMASTFTFNQPNTSVTLSINFSAYDKSTAPPYSDPAYQLKAEEHPYVHLKDVATGNIIYSARHLNGASPLYYTVNVPLTQGREYELLAECYVNAPNTYAGISFTYNTTTNVQGIKPAGGLRIRSTENFSANAASLSKDIYKYGGNEDGIGRLSSVVADANSFSFNRPYEWDSKKLGCIGCFGPYLLTKTNYSASSIYGFGLASGSSVIYPMISKYHVSGSADNGKTVSYYDTYADVVPHLMPSGAEIPFYFITDKWANHRLKKQEIFRKEGTEYKVMKRVTNHYARYNAPDNTFYKIGFNRDMSHGAVFTYDKFYVKELRLTSGTYKLDTVVTEDMEGSSTMTTAKTVLYDPLYHDFPVEEKTTDSQNKSKVNTYKYAFQKSSISGLTPEANNALDKMLLQNNVGAIVDQQYSRNGSLLQTVRTNYKIFSDISPDMVQRSGVQSKYTTSAFEDRLFYTDYDDAGNLRSQKLANGTTSCYIWGYNKSLPVAEISNSDYQTVVNVLGQTVINQLGGANPGTDAEVRNKLAVLRTSALMKNAEVKVYTYQPLVGVTSVTDPKGTVTYYEYDNLQRLKFIKDHSGNILKNYCYSYANQVAACAIPISNQVQSQTFTRSNCSGGNTGSSYTYTVEAGKYYANTQAEANQLALNEIAANGQNQANANGTCTPIPANPYIKLETKSGYLGSDNHYYVVYSFKAYSDAAMTIPMTVSSNYSVAYKQTSTTTYSNGSPNTTTVMNKSTSILSGSSYRDITVDVNTCGQAAPASMMAENSSQAATTAGSGSDQPNGTQTGGMSSADTEQSAQETSTGTQSAGTTTQASTVEQGDGGATTNAVPGDGGGGGGTTSCTTTELSLTPTVNPV